MKITYPEMRIIYDNALKSIHEKIFIDGKNAHGWNQEEFLEIYLQESIDDEVLEFVTSSISLH